MIIREKIKKFALGHKKILLIYRASLGKLKTKYYFNFQKKALQKNGEKYIRRIDKALHDKNVEFFIDGGTLLGMVRERHLIKHDRDMDYGIYFSKSFTLEDLDKAMKSAGFKKIKAFVFRDKPYEITYGNGVTHVDFFIHDEVNEESLLYVFYRDIAADYPGDQFYSVLEMHRPAIKGLRRVNIDGLRVNIPVNYKEYLAGAYTEKWRIPDPTWSYHMEPGKVMIEGEYGILEKY